MKVFKSPDQIAEEYEAEEGEWMYFSETAEMLSRLQIDTDAGWWPGTGSRLPVMDDPLWLYVIDPGPDDGDFYEAVFVAGMSLREVFHSWIDEAEEGGLGDDDKFEGDALRRISNALKDLASDMDRALATGEKRAAERLAERDK